MGFFDFLKAPFDKGGIKARLAVPNNFTWGDETIPVTVTLTGHKSEPRTIRTLMFTVEDELESSKVNDSDNDEKRFGSRVRVAWEREEIIELAPGQTVSLEVPVMLEVVGEEATPAAEEALAGTRLGKLAGAAGRMGMTFGSTSNPRHIQNYRITVQALAVGAKTAVRHSRPIRQGGAFRLT